MMEFLLFYRKKIADTYNEILKIKELDFKITEADVDLDDTYAVYDKTVCSSKGLAIPVYYNNSARAVYCNLLFADIIYDTSLKSDSCNYRIEKDGWILLEKFPKELQKAIKKLWRKNKLGFFRGYSTGFLST